MIPESAPPTIRVFIIFFLFLVALLSINIALITIILFLLCTYFHSKNQQFHLFLPFKLSSIITNQGRTILASPFWMRTIFWFWWRKVWGWREISRANKSWKSLFFPSHHPHEVLEWEEGHRIDGERSQHGDAQSLEESLVTLHLVLMLSTFQHISVFQVAQLLRLHNSLDIVNRIGPKPAIGSSNSSSQKGSLNGSVGRTFPSGKQSHDILVSIEVNCVGSDLSDESWWES